ncbi:MAG TPA: chromate efflux transporter [Candidatus Kapabacteria bacterium]|nr:chromate efflux transporter [Candidatus Kapabacteria bacterium]
MSGQVTSTLPGSREYSLRGLLLYFLGLGTWGFGGPIALVVYMEKDLVEDRGWLTEEEYRRGLALSQIAPGPLAAQLAMYIGYIRNGFIGVTLVSIAFIAPSFIMVVALGMLYVAFGGLAWMQAVFYMIGAAVIGIIARSAYKLAYRILKKKKLLWGIFALMCAVTAYTEQENVWLFLLSGCIALFIYAPPRLNMRKLSAFIVPALLLFQFSIKMQQTSFTEIFLYFVKAGAFVFGSGLAIVPFLHGDVVQHYQWLTERQFLDAVAVAMVTPGPVVITVGFIGYLVGGFWGAVAAALGVFLPVYLVIILISSYYERIAKNKYITAFIDGVIAAAVGAIAGAVIVLGRRSITDIPTVFTTLVTLGVLIRFKIPEPIIIAIAGAVGLVLYWSKNSALF